LIAADTSHWIPSIVNSVFNDISAREILKMRSMQNPKPQYIWTPSGSGKFSISSAFLTLVRSHWPVCSPNATLDFWKSLWKLNLNDRLRNLLWKIAWNIILTKDHLNAVLPYSI